MDNYRLQAQRGSRNRGAFVLQLVLLFLMMALSGLIGLIWFGGERLLFPPTPTPTATPGPRLVATPDFRSTLIAEDIATQAAYRTLAAELGLSPLVAPTKAIDAVIAPTNTINLPVVMDEGEETPATAVAAVDTGTTGTGSAVSVSLPVVVNNSFVPTPTPTSVVISELSTETPTETLTETPLPLPSDTPTLAPPTDIPTPTPTIYFVTSLNAVIIATPVATLHDGPSNLYGVSGTLPGGQTVNLFGRDETGEWVVVCCLDNNARWLRQVYAPPRDNVLPTVVPTSVNPNDVRWLKVDVAPPTTVPILTPTVIPDNTFPLSRRDRGNTGHVTQLPLWPLTQIWLDPPRAQPMISPPVVANNKVIVASADNHLYAFAAGTGNQQWRFDVGARVTTAPAVQDNFIYFADEQGHVFGLQDLENVATPILTTLNLAGRPQSNMYLAGNRLLLIIRLTGGNQEYQLHFIDRTNGGDQNHQSSAMTPYLAVGNQLVYAGVPRLTAFDINDKSIIWVNNDIEDLTAPPVFVVNGPRALAELYVADSKNGGRLLIVDANTGQTLWTYVLNRRINGIAVNDSGIYVTGDNFVRAFPRQATATTPAWEIGISGQAMGGPLIDNNQLLVVTTGRQIQGINFGGVSIGNMTIPGDHAVVAAPAVSGPYLYIPTTDSVVYAFQGQ